MLLTGLYTVESWTGTRSAGVSTIKLVTKVGTLCGSGYPCAKYDLTSADATAKLVGEKYLKGKLAYEAGGKVAWNDATTDTTAASIAMLCGAKWRMDSLGVVTFKDDVKKLCYGWSYL